MLLGSPTGNDCQVVLALQHQIEQYTVSPIDCGKILPAQLQLLWQLLGFPSDHELCVGGCTAGRLDKEQQVIMVYAVCWRDAGDKLLQNRSAKAHSLVQMYNAELSTCLSR